MLGSDFDFDLPQELIAQRPLEDRAAAKMLVMEREGGRRATSDFHHFAEYLQPGDCLVLNCVSNVEKAMKHLDAYGRINCFLDRDEAGRRTLDVLGKRHGGRVCDRSALYDGCKDLNEYLQLTTKKEMDNNLKIKLK